ncbi:sulfurtransferase TusA family protein [Candidatus Kinetoplastidibacterium galati]|uniref:SirA-like two-component response regulator n=1 Tax=Candidatus Kinetoplastidibacterium galati TCC219 TaxID=1208921 RepID=M1L964_9PROT|nr:sulfurtransferase TusA family protein [Candidatus Kinetoplastibacterium galatii]AGF49103.1 SirA-like two-component response regulator [Candidatus Kinetoplastibacterium galatii TCC219]
MEKEKFDKNSNDDMHYYDDILDVTKLSCPIPILNTKKALSKMDSGKILRITISSNVDSLNDFIIFAKQTGNSIVLKEKYKENGLEYTVIYIRRR